MGPRVRADAYMSGPFLEKRHLSGKICLEQAF